VSGGEVDHGTTAEGNGEHNHTHHRVSLNKIMNNSLHIKSRVYISHDTKGAHMRDNEAKGARYIFTKTK